MLNFCAPSKEGIICNECYLHYEMFIALHTQAYLKFFIGLQVELGLSLKSLLFETFLMIAFDCTVWNDVTDDTSIAISFVCTISMIQHGFQKWKENIRAMHKKYQKKENRIKKALPKYINFYF